MNTSVDLGGKRALVTGASRGIGKAIAISLARAGCDVVVGYGSDEAVAHAVCREVAALGRSALAVQCDLANPASISELFKQARENLGVLDIVVANAGVELIDIPLVEYTQSQYDRVFDVNTRGTFFTLLSGEVE